MQVDSLCYQLRLLRAITFQRNPVHDPMTQAIVHRRGMHYTPVVPHCHVTFRPTPSDLKARLLTVLAKQIHQVAALDIGQTHYAGGEGPIDV